MPPKKFGGAVAGLAVDVLESVCDADAVPDDFRLKSQPHSNGKLSAIVDVGTLERVDVGVDDVVAVDVRVDVAVLVEDIVGIADRLRDGVIVRLVVTVLLAVLRPLIERVALVVTDLTAAVVTVPERKAVEERVATDDGTAVVLRLTDEDAKCVTEGLEEIDALLDDVPAAPCATSAITSVDAPKPALEASEHRSNESARASSTRPLIVPSVPRQECKAALGEARKPCLSNTRRSTLGMPLRCRTRAFAPRGASGGAARE